MKNDRKKIIIAAAVLATLAGGTAITCGAVNAMQKKTDDISESAPEKPADAPELPEGEMPELDGELPPEPPEGFDGERPEFDPENRPDDLPELPEGEHPEGERPEGAPEGMPPMDGERPELKDGEEPPKRPEDMTEEELAELRAKIEAEIKANRTEE